jgi:hypothetical protein
MINGTCVICDKDQDLVPVCISCISDNKIEQAHYKPKEAQNSPSKAVSRNLGSPNQETIKRALDRLREECGYGNPEGYE